MGQSQGYWRTSQWAPPLTWRQGQGWGEQKLVAAGYREWELEVEVDIVAARDGNGIGGRGAEEEAVGHQQILMGSYVPGSVLGTVDTAKEYTERVSGLQNKGG